MGHLAVVYGNPRYPRVSLTIRGEYRPQLEVGAGEGIRTLDPDLGKVVLYP